MAERPTINEVLASESLRRRLAERVLRPGPWKHSWYIHPTKPTRGAVTIYPWKCSRCKQEKYLLTSEVDKPEHRMGCEVPPPVHGSEADIAERLVKKCQPEAVRDAVLAMGDIVRPDVGIDEPEWLLWWVFEATPAERIACCLKALGEVA